VFQGRWVNFVQARQQHNPARFALLGMKYRGPSTVEAHREGVTQYSESFVCYTQTKIAFKASGTIELDRGQHALLRGPDHVCGPVMEIFHLPLRSQQEIVKRGMNYEPRRAATRPSADVSWQSAFHREVVTAGRVDAVWAANSFDREARLDVYGGALDLVPNDRLRQVLIRAAWHLFRTYGLIAF
jgi:hypothetical protein